MILCIADLLPPEEVKAVREALDEATFFDGKKTAGWHAKLVKENLQLASGNPAIDALRERLTARVRENELFQMAVRPKAVTPVIVSRYEPGMRYGTHVDDAVMHGIRTDVSFTVFLEDPESYDGGELVMESTAGEEAFKLPAGAAIVYPSGQLHRVEEVTRGARVAIVGWAESMIRDPRQREILFDLDSARRTIFQSQGKTAEFDLITKSVANLIRMWAET
ncbi:Fe2+-dependent dioxygenase [Azospirillum soli]|uniref:Fe2+-dependent dioxygenase n=1 Tax=Azospirillum soli TaxID=1304799 RepID=UPI001AE16D1C|nr:Fe2+-dependent dioxygenase [Azospirillum soli]MBP2314813.1 PKHD-type hydroxylase [Azospirillum soli]